MTRQIRISDESYQWLDAQAKANHRSKIGDQVAAIIAQVKEALKRKDR